MSEFIYHYTDKAGRDGICDDNNVWFKLTSKSRNDDEDTSYIRTVLKKIKLDDNYFNNKALEVMQSVLNPVGFEKCNSYITKNIFMFCVMENTDDKTGRSLHDTSKDVFRIQIDKKKLMSFLINNKEFNQYGTFVFGNMIYDKDTQEKRIKDIFFTYQNLYEVYCGGGKGIFINNYHGSTPANDYTGISGNIPFFVDQKWCSKDWSCYSQEQKKEIDNMWVGIANEFYKISTFIKKCKFENENEFRFAYLRNQKDKENITLNSYFSIEIKIPRECIISNICIGKGTNKKMR